MKDLIMKCSAVECRVCQDISHEAGKNCIVFSIKFTVLPSINTVLASKTVTQLGALVEHIMKNDGIGVDG